MSASDVYIPPEVVDLIVGNLTLTEDKVTFQSCTLISRSFSFAARRRIFSTIAINGYKTRQDKNIIRRTKDLAGLLANEQSDLPLLVRTLQIRMNYRRVIFREDSHLDKLLSVIKSRATSLSSLMLGSETHWLQRKYYWSDIPSQIASRLLDICRTLPISQLRFYLLLDIPKSIIIVAQCPHLRCIDLYGSTFKGHGKSSNRPGEADDAISKFASYFPPHGQYLVSYSEHRLTVKSVDVYDTGDLPILVTLLEHASTSLVSFNCSFFCRHFLNLAEFDLGRMAQLRTASLRVHSSIEDLVILLSALANFLSHGPAKAHTLREIQLIVRASILNRAWFSYLAKQCKAINLPLNLLSDKYPGLQKVTICLELTLPQHSNHFSPPFDSAEAEKLEQDYGALLTNVLQLSNTASGLPLSYLQGRVAIKPTMTYFADSVWYDSWQ